MNDNPISLGDTENARQVVEGWQFALAEAQNDVLEEVLRRSEAIVRAQSYGEKEALTADVAKATGCRKETAWRILSALYGLASIASSGPKLDDPVGSILDALRRGFEKLGEQLERPQEDKLRRVIDQLVEDRTELRQAIVSGKVARGHLPMFYDMDATVELRSNRPPFAESEELSNLELELTPIASIRLMLDSGDPANVCFQMTDTDLVSLTEKIAKLRAEMRHLRKSIKVQRAE